MSAIETSASGATRAILADGRRRHFQHGPIDLVIECFGDTAECARAYDQAWSRFASVLPELVRELPLLRKPITAAPCPLAGPVARRMWYASLPHAARFITPMAAVAGAVADEVMAAMVAGRALRRAYVNNGGDIALFLAAGERFSTGIVGDLRKPKPIAESVVAHDDPVRGIATSGWQGRSFSLGIADAVTVLARTAAEADAAATMVANAVDVDHPAIERRPARALDPDSDLGELPVTVAVGALPARAIEVALDAGERHAAALRAQRSIAGALLMLRGRTRIVGAARPPEGRRAAAFRHTATALQGVT
jgi:hypothetical protein